MATTAVVEQRPRMQYKWQAAIVVVIGLFLSVLDNTIVSVALPNMRAAFGTDFASVTWVATSYFLAQAGIIPATGYLSDRWGMKIVFVTALGIFLVGSLLCAVAPTQPFLIAARVVQGIGGGALMPISFAIAYRAFPRDEWGRATTIIGIPVLLAPVLGPIVGGYLTTAFQWRAIFTINLPIGGAGFILAMALLRSRSADGPLGLDGDAQGPFDLLGLTLSTVGFTALVYGLLQAGTQGWSDRMADIAILLGAALIVALVVVEYRMRAPVLDVRLFRINTFAIANVLLWLVVASFYGTLFLIPFYYETIQNASALTAGEIMIGQGVASAVAIALAGELYNTLGPRVLVSVGVVALGVSMIGFTHLTLNTTGLSIQPWMLLRGLGLGLTTIPLQNLALSVVRHRDVARASSLVNATRQVFAAAGLAALTAFVTQRSIGHIATIRAALNAHATTACLTAPPSAAAGCVRHQGTVMGLNDAFTLVLIACGVALILALSLGHDPSLVALKTMTPDRLAEIFPYLPKLDLVEITSRMRPRSFAPGDTIVQEGDAPEYFYILAKGEVQVTARDKTGVERELRRMGPGEFFGEIGLLGNRPRTATIIATEPSEVLVMDRFTFAELVDGSERTRDQLARAMGERLAVVP